MEDTDLLGLGRPDFEPKATETIPEIVALIEELIRDGHAYAAGGDVYFRVGRYPEYGALSGQRPDQVQEQEDEANPLKEDPRDFALWKANKAGEDTWWDSPWGPGRPGWHIECSAMAEKFLGDPFEIHIAGLDLVFPHNENELAQSRAAGREFARIWMHNGMLELTGEKMSKSIGNIATLRDVVEQWGRETVLLYFLTAHWRKPIDFSDETMAQAAAQVETFRNAFRGEERDGGDWAPFAAALDDDFDTPAALAVMHEWRRAGQLSPLRDALERLRPRLSRRGGGAASRAGRARPAAAGRRARRGDFAEADRLRAEIDAAGWEVRDEPGGFRLVPTVSRDLVYGRRAVHEALRGPREVLELWATERAEKSEPWLAEAPLRLQVKPDRALSEAAETRDHQGVVAWCSPYRYADAYELAAAERPLIACLDQVSDPRNLGAVCRSAEGAGATGVVLPGARLGDGDRRGLQGLGRRGRAPAGRGRHEPRPLARRGEARRPLGLRRLRRRRDGDVGRGPHRRLDPRLRRRGQGDPPARAPHLRRGDLDPAARPRRVAERQRRRGTAALRSKAPAPCLTTPCVACHTCCFRECTGEPSSKNRGTVHVTCNTRGRGA